ncbi:MAG TPA: hypothetical protein VF101_04755 [Gaiellaceae bacterium]
MSDGGSLLNGSGADGVVVVTRFDGVTVLTLPLFVLIHRLVARDVRRVAREDGFIGVRFFRDRRARVVWSVSLWTHLDAVRAMGRVNRHVMAARLPGRLGWTTRSGVFRFGGDWRAVLFDSKLHTRNPLTEATQAEKEDAPWLS